MMTCDCQLSRDQDESSHKLHSVEPIQDTVAGIFPLSSPLIGSASSTATKTCPGAGVARNESIIEPGEGVRESDNVGLLSERQTLALSGR